MKTRFYTALGFLTWEGVKLVARRKLQQNRGTLAAGATVLLVVIGGFVAAKAGSSDE
jgi:hypothetical protein